MNQGMVLLGVRSGNTWYVLERVDRSYGGWDMGMGGIKANFEAFGLSNWINGQSHGEFWQRSKLEVGIESFLLTLWPYYKNKVENENS